VLVETDSPRKTIDHRLQTAYYLRTLCSEGSSTGHDLEIYCASNNICKQTVADIHTSKLAGVQAPEDRGALILRFFFIQSLSHTTIFVPRCD